jgi:AraC family transcriptional regulator, alkane utilization regulator
MTSTPERVDLLPQLIRMIQLTGAAFLEAELRSPWSLRVSAARVISAAPLPKEQDVMICHVVTEGRCAVRGSDGRVVDLRSGEILILPNGDSHVICCADEAAENTRERDLFSFVRAQRTKIVNAGASGDVTRLISGFLACDPQFTSPVRATLPRLIHINLRDDARGRWLQSTVRFLAHESAHPQASGAATVLTRLSELILAEAVRRSLEDAPWSKHDWLSGLRDPYAAKALALMHEQPQRTWCVDRLACAAGVARSTLADRFARSVGQPPMQYFKRLRLSLAAKDLSESKLGIGQIAARAGYDSEAAFTRAFKRQFGLPPGAWRKQSGGRPTFALGAASELHDDIAMSLA